MLTENSILQIADGKGTYAIVMQSQIADKSIQVGKLPKFKLDMGTYIYTGSAFGSGGIRARLNHHIKIAKRQHWHLDYIRPYLQVSALWYCYTQHNQEHLWAKTIAGIRGAKMPSEGFGSSDCSCLTHLWYFPHGLTYRTFRRHLTLTAPFQHERIYSVRSLTNIPTTIDPA